MGLRIQCTVLCIHLMPWDYASNAQSYTYISCLCPAAHPQACAEACSFTSNAQSYACPLCVSSCIPEIAHHQHRRRLVRQAAQRHLQTGVAKQLFGKAGSGDRSARPTDGPGGPMITPSCADHALIIERQVFEWPRGHSSGQGGTGVWLTRAAVRFSNGMSSNGPSLAPAAHRERGVSSAPGRKSERRFFSTVMRRRPGQQRGATERRANDRLAARPFRLRIQGVYTGCVYRLLGAYRHPGPAFLRAKSCSGVAPPRLCKPIPLLGCVPLCLSKCGPVSYCLFLVSLRNYPLPLTTHTHTHTHTHIHTHTLPPPSSSSNPATVCWHLPFSTSAFPTPISRQTHPSISQYFPSHLISPLYFISPCIPLSSTPPPGTPVHSSAGGRPLRAPVVGEALELSEREAVEVLACAMAGAGAGQ